VLPLPGRGGADDSWSPVRMLGLEVLFPMTPRRVQAWPSKLTQRLTCRVTTPHLRANTHTRSGGEGAC
jgi:hypothetical protein